jgi:hypothetical protein
MFFEKLAIYPPCRAEHVGHCEFTASRLRIWVVSIVPRNGVRVDLVDEAHCLYVSFELRRSWLHEQPCARDTAHI